MFKNDSELTLPEVIESARNNSWDVERPHLGWGRGIEESGVENEQGRVGVARGRHLRPTKSSFLL